MKSYQTMQNSYTAVTFIFAAKVLAVLPKLVLLFLT